jgi:outer membrane protein OmpA-like peptidoglycan-associated protein
MMKAKTDAKHTQSNRFITGANITLSVVLTLMLVLSGCSASRTAKGGAIGSGAGGAIGGVIGSQSDHTAKGAILGAMIGGAAGAIIGEYMDRQANELEGELEGATVERVGEGIQITFDSGILFDFDSYTLREASEINLRELAETLKEYDETKVLIEGHTDNVGTDAYNMNLSRQRAASVEDYLSILGVSDDRLISKGYGEEQPVASNDTDAGRQQNRRVEIAIYANDDLKEAAREGEL